MRYKKLLIDCYEQVKKFRDKGVPIIYLDEAIFTFHTIKKRAWYSKLENLKVSQESRQMKPLALVAAIESDRGLVSYAIREGSINAESFIEFLVQLKEHMSCPEICLFLDNLSVHKTKKVKEKLSELNIHPVYNVPYSPDFNGIESYFSLVKGEYKNLWMQLYVKEEAIEPEALVRQVLDKNI
jgi:transposase